ncbi:MAG: hypothetical protein ABWY93_06605, partial [Mycobacterium sp.]
QPACAPSRRSAAPESMMDETVTQWNRMSVPNDAPANAPTRTERHVRVSPSTGGGLSDELCKRS